MPKETKPRTNAIVVVGLCVGVAALYFAQEFLKPLALAFLLCFVLAPASNWLERRLRFNRTLSVLTVVAATLMFIVGAGYVLGMQISALGGEVPAYAKKVEAKLASARGFADRMAAKLDVVKREATSASDSNGATRPAATTAPAGEVHTPATLPFSSPSATVAKPGETGPFDLSNGPWRELTGVFAPVLTMLGTALIIAVFVVFMLVQREDLRDRMIRLLSKRHIGLTTQAMDDAGGRISHYLRVLCIVNVCYGVILGTGFYFIGIPAPVLWGMLCCLLRFVPYVGPLVSAVLPLGLSIAVSDGWGMFFWTIAMFGGVELVTANFIEPLIYGRHTGVSPMAVIISAAFWGWLWGIEGLLMATPLTLCLAVVGRHVKALSFLSVMLGDEPALPVHLRYYQRLLAGDDAESTVLLKTAGDQGGIIGAFDEAALPALGIAEADARAGRIEPEHFRKMLKSLRTQVDALAEQHRSASVVKSARGGVETLQCAVPENVRLATQPLPVHMPKRSTRPAGTGTARGSIVERSMDRLRMHRSKRREMVGAAPASAGPLTNTYAPVASLPRDCVVKVHVLPARDEPDEIAGLMLAHVLRSAGYACETKSSTSLTTELVADVGSGEADLVVVSSTPPSAVAAARYLLKKMSGIQGNGTPVLVTLWSGHKGGVKEMRSYRGEGRVPVARSICEAVECVRQLTAQRVASGLASGTPANAGV